MPALEAIEDRAKFKDIVFTQESGHIVRREKPQNPIGRRKKAAREENFVGAMILSHYGARFNVHRLRGPEVGMCAPELARCSPKSGLP